MFIQCSDGSVIHVKRQTLNFLVCKPIDVYEDVLVVSLFTGTKLRICNTVTVVCTDISRSNAGWLMSF